MNKIKKRKIRKRTKIILGVILFLFFKIVSPYLYTPREIKELNNNINFPYKLISPLEEFDEEGWEEDPGYNEVYYYNPQVGSIRFKGYPDLINSRKVTYIGTENPKFFLFGFHVGDNMTIVDNIMKENGYRRKKTDYDDYKYYKGKIYISLLAERMEIGYGEGKIDVDILRAFGISIGSSDWFHRGIYK